VTTRTYSERTTERIGLSIIGFLTQFAIAFLTAWFVMLGLDVANDHWPLPDIGYWGVFALILGISSLAGAIHGGMRVKVKQD
jgi:hypothetical protein